VVERMCPVEPVPRENRLNIAPRRPRASTISCGSAKSTAPPVTRYRLRKTWRTQVSSAAATATTITVRWPRMWMSNGHVRTFDASRRPVQPSECSSSPKMAVEQDPRRDAGHGRGVLQRPVRGEDQVHHDPPVLEWTRGEAQAVLSDGGLGRPTPLRRHSNVGDRSHRNPSRP